MKRINKGNALIEASKEMKATTILVTNEVTFRDQKFFELMFN
ncbi:bifunctional adenosylcobinamide kinase/adenosylcobinamide-phosphate guanylyltransferase [Fulvivirga ulvae]|nr:bifunctional adenosylcobinamide kinase/adenosylcobinamide-phosphate guanylyltransferase [Fulvivirga ulvae]UII32598.1 bifunctional adenosylcobinamide kinase/adenosylcobinamide-phosphate guanylyltransferase [Fulvivirga ulvae]